MRHDDLLEDTCRPRRPDGVGANALIGGSKNGVVLQPLSVEGLQGFNIAGGIGILNLRAR